MCCSEAPPVGPGGNSEPALECPAEHLSASIAQRNRHAFDAGIGHGEPTLRLLHAQALYEVCRRRSERRLEAPRHLSGAQTDAARERIDGDPPVKIGGNPPRDVRKTI